MATFNDIINKNQLVLVDFFASWCGPCKTMSPILSQVKNKVKNKVKIVKIDVDKNPKTAQKNQVQGVPTLVLYKNGKQIWKQSGVVPAIFLIDLINKNN
jgi:thioredoxin 1